MALETGTYIDDLNSSNPTGSDGKDEGDDHFRLIKSFIKASFPNISGAMTATHTELNFLAGQKGGFLTDYIVDAAGSVNAITADFTPNVSLTDDVTVIVQALGANTSATVTFAPDGLTAKNIKKHGNQSLVIGDIFGAGHRLILSYDSGNDVWELLNPISGALGLTSSGFTVAGQFYNATNGVIATGFNIAAVIGTSFEDIGPTSASATNTWTALDNIPLTATAVLLQINNSLEGSTNTDQYLGTIHMRKKGSGVSLGVASEASETGFTNRSGSSENSFNVSQSVAPLDATNSFDMALVKSGTSPTSVANMYIVGFWL